MSMSLNGFINGSLAWAVSELRHRTAATIRFRTTSLFIMIAWTSWSLGTPPFTARPEVHIASMPTAFRQVGFLATSGRKSRRLLLCPRGACSAILASVQTRRNQNQTVYYAKPQRAYGGNAAIAWRYPIPPFDAALRPRYNLHQGSCEREVPLPLYEYQCRKCGRRVERIQKFSDPPLTTCEECAGELEQLISSP